MDFELQKYLFKVGPVALTDGTGLLYADVYQEAVVREANKTL
ncbi:hypothetical protein [Paenibacillus sacheonensis]|nr:hypothetical protein [Paenibacillus sacheonensis]MBM7567790.1 hypothetical protein [Paenibacillus sacheonensis]